MGRPERGITVSVLYLDCGMGAAGDMFTAALYDLLDADGKRKFLAEINSAGVEGVTVIAESAVKSGIRGTHMKVLIDGAEEMDHHHDHHHDHDHHHASTRDISEVIRSTAFSNKVKNDAIAVYGLIAGAESRVHGKTVDEIHFHEVGTKDAIIDVLGACRLIEMLAPDEIMASPVCTGFGEVKCAHGIMPVPAPATAVLLEGIPMYAGDVRSELCTPTGAALLKFFVKDFANMPMMTIRGTGYGCGFKDFPRANVVRAFIGERMNVSGSGADSAKGISQKGVVELSTNIDDMTGEAIGFAAEKMRMAGALEVYVTPVYMKKNRPGHVLTVLCREEDEEALSALFFKHTSTWGIRRRNVERRYMDTMIETVDTEFGSVRFKVGTGYGVTKSKPEYEDVARIAELRKISIAEILGKISF